MSIEAQEQLETKTIHDTAAGLNADFQFVAEYLPVEVKEAYAGEAFTLASIAGVGILWASYNGQCDRPKPPFDPRNSEPICDLSVIVGVQADGYDGILGYTKLFGLTYDTLHATGPLADLEPIEADDLQGDRAPAPEMINELGLILHALKAEYARTWHLDELSEAAA